METKFNFNSQVCTDRFQSEHLLALGLKKETADCYLVVEKEEVTVVAKPYYEIIEDLNSLPFDAEIIPAWSLHRLWELANIKHIILDSEDEIAVLYDEVIMKIGQFIEEGYFNKEYLEE